MPERFAKPPRAQQIEPIEERGADCVRPGGHRDFSERL